MRSRKLSPGFAVTRTTMRSESTRVPPVTALRSPPDSRMTGADSPVMADSSIVAAPSRTSPSAGTTSPASTVYRSPLRSSVLATRSSVPSSFKRRAYVSDLVRRSASAWALPRPSATASAKFAKSTVNQSHAAIAKSNPTVDAWAAKSRTKKMVVAAAPTSTTNITGLRACQRGSSFLNESASARVRIARSKSESAFGRRSKRRWVSISRSSLVVRGGARRPARASRPEERSARRRSRSRR